MAATPISLTCAGCCTDCGCCSTGATRFDVSNSFTGLANGTCSRCATNNQAWRRSMWRGLCKDNFQCTWTSLFEQTSNTLLCSGTNQYQGARLTMVCDATNVTLTLTLLAHPTLVAPSSMTVRATYQKVVSFPLACDGAIVVLDWVSDDGSCTGWPATCTVTGSQLACP